MKARPLVKRVGGKSALLDQIVPHLPRTFGRYFDLFFGGGAMFFELKPGVAFLSDACPHLIGCYRAVRDDVESVIGHLGSFSNDAACYYETRMRYNDGHAGCNGDSWRAAAFIYMNRVCFNGVWRVNRGGGMNVPFGDMPNAKICDAENLCAVSAMLRSPGVELVRADFGMPLDGMLDVRPGDLFYFDPPYIPASSTANFTSYTVDGFTIDDQVRLRDTIRDLSERGVYCVASNSDTPKTRELYDGFELVQVWRKGTVSSKGAARQLVPELLILGGQWEKRVPDADLKPISQLEPAELVATRLDSASC